MAAITKDSIKNVLDGMLGAIKQEEIDLYKKIIGDNVPVIVDIDNFHAFLIHPYKQFLNGLISTEISGNDKVKFLLLNSSFVEYHFLYWIEKKEGPACSADKSRTILKSIFRFLKTETEKIEWDYTQEFTFHLPKKVFTTQDEVITFFESLVSLHYGNPGKYLECVKELLKTDK